MTIELIKEIKVGKELYWIKANNQWAYVFSSLEEAEAKYQALQHNKLEDSFEVLKSTTISADNPTDIENKTYSVQDMLTCWNAAYTDALISDEESYKPLFFEIFIKSLK
jgi:hypothetical protein